MHYTFRDTNTDEIVNLEMSLSEYEKYVKKNKHMEQQIGSPLITSGVSRGKNKPSGEFRSLLKAMKKKNPRSTINTW